MKGKKGPGFNPEEIIFCPTSACNLKCPHCFVDQKPSKLSADDAIMLLRDCAQNSAIAKTGFSGGEPFLNLEFTCAVIEETVRCDMMFDRLMTNGAWWKTEKELEEKLSLVRAAGFDGKIGLSWDKFHGQSTERIATFIQKCFEIFNDNSCVEILSVINQQDESDRKEFETNVLTLTELLGFTDVIANLDKKTGTGSITIKGENGGNISIYRFAQSFLPNEKTKRFTDKKWFSDDYCQSTGNVLYVHADGNIAPCCGFANECSGLLIGKITDNYATLIENSKKNVMVNLCYEDGLLKEAKSLQKKGLIPKGKCGDMCQICALICELKK